MLTKVCASPILQLNKRSLFTMFLVALTKHSKPPKEQGFILARDWRVLPIAVGRAEWWADETPATFCLLSGSRGMNARLRSFLLLMGALPMGRCCPHPVCAFSSVEPSGNPYPAVSVSVTVKMNHHYRRDTAVCCHMTVQCAHGGLGLPFQSLHHSLLL